MIRSNQRIAIFMPSLFGGGGQRSMLNLAQGMADCGYDVDLVLAKRVGAFCNEIPESVRLVDLKCSRTLTSLPALVRYLRRERPAAMLSVFGYVNIVAIWAWRIAHVPTKLFVMEQNTVSQEAGNASNWRTRLTPSLMKRFYPWASGIVVVSEGVREDLARVAKIAPERITVIYNPSVVVDQIQRKAQMPVDHPWFDPGQPPVIVSVGRLQMQKDYPTLLEAFALVRQQRSARLMILGEGPERTALEQQISRLGLTDDVCLPGFVDNPYALMAKASLFVLSSRWEGLPTVLIEALCCGTPVVSTDCPSGPQEILDGGKYGRLVPVSDVPALADAMVSALAEEVIRPPNESWQPYELNSVVDRYASALLGTTRSQQLA